VSSVELYEGIRRENRAAILAGDIVVDESLGPKAVRDGRRGIGLILPIPEGGELFKGLRKAAGRCLPEQYLVPADDYHITVFEFKSATEGYERDEGFEREVAELCDAVLAGLGGMAISFKGIVFSRAAGIIKGYDEGALVELRRRLRAAMRDRGLPLRERYESESAHVTFCRFLRPLADMRRLEDFIDRHGEMEYGTLSLGGMELVESDWHNRRAARRALKSYALND
jgi:hypothetical protein